MIRQIEHEQWLENIKLLYFWNKHNFPPLPHTVEGNYLEQHRETAVGNLHYITYIILHYITYIILHYLYYIDYKCKTLISAFCVIGKCPTPTNNNREKAK